MRIFDIRRGKDRRPPSPLFPECRNIHTKRLSIEDDPLNTAQSNPGQSRLQSIIRVTAFAARYAPIFKQLFHDR